MSGIFEGGGATSYAVWTALFSTTLYVLFCTTGMSGVVYRITAV